MELAVITLVALTCSITMSVLAFMVGRCARRLPIDGMLPRVVRSTRFSPGEAMPPPRRMPQDPTGAHGVQTPCLENPAQTDN